MTRTQFRARLMSLSLDNGARAIADQELGAFLNSLTRSQAEKITTEYLWFATPLDRAEVVAAVFGDVISFERRRELLAEELTEDRREILDEIVSRAMQAWHPIGKDPHHER